MRRLRKVPLHADNSVDKINDRTYVITNKITTAKNFRWLMAQLAETVKH